MNIHRTAPIRISSAWPGATFLKLGFAAALVPFLGVCSPAPMPISRSSNDPSSPSAPEGISALLATSAPHPAAHTEHVDHAEAADAGTEGVVYACPMHPEVTSTKPGELCPKCNMKLVPKK